MLNLVAVDGRLFRRLPVLCVGHASGYIAVMSLLNLAPEEIANAPVLNIFVASITAWQFYRAGIFRGVVLAVRDFSIPWRSRRLRSAADTLV